MITFPCYIRVTCLR